MDSRNRHGQELAAMAETGQVGGVVQPAATVILLRDAPSGMEALMLQRNSQLAFGGMWVFPGGRVDEADRRAAAGNELVSARRAAVRESLEEAGLVLDEAGLLPFSHWTPPVISPRRFLTWFFVARAPAASVSIDGGEIQEHAWMSPTRALERRQAGEIELAIPTFVTLHKLTALPSVERVLAYARSREPERFATRIVRTPGGPVALWHGDAGYEASDPDRHGPRHRLWMLDAGWRYERGA